MISVVVLTKNEETDIGTCLEQLSWCDDVHVLDSGSSDDTVELARKGGALVSSHVQCGPSFSLPAQRNWALRHLNLRHAWVLFVDADEDAGEEYAAAIRTAIEAEPDRQGFLTAPKFMYHGRWLKRTKSFPTWEPRVIRRGAIELLEGQWDRFPSDADVGRVAVPFGHRANSKGLGSWVEKHVRYASWEAATMTSGTEDRSESKARVLARSLGPVRPLAVYLHFLLIRGALFEGPEGRSYARRMFIYELLVREQVSEMEAVRAGRAL